MKRSLLSLLLLTVITLVTAQPGRIVVPSPLVRSGGPPGLVRASINSNALQALHAAGNNPIRLTNFPLKDTTSADLDVVPFDVLTSDAVVVGVKADGKQVTIRNTVKLLRGRLKGKPHSSLVLGFTAKGVTGFIQDENDGLFIVAQDHVQADTVIYNAADSTAPLAMLEDEVLEVPDEGRKLLETLQEQQQHLRHKQQHRDLQAGTERCYRIAVVTLSDFQAGLGRTLTEKADYIKTVMAAVSVLLAGIQDWKNDYYITNDFQMYAAVSYIRVYEDNAEDWYIPSLTCEMEGLISDNCLLGATRSYWQSNPPPEPYHVLITLTKACGPYGGVAWLDSICTVWRYAIAGCLSGHFPLPVEDHFGNPAGDTWDLVVVAHELGHSFSAPHTHEFSPPIDKCAKNCKVPDGGGTIMSYCHTCAGGTSNIDVRFHQDIISFMSSTLKSRTDSCASLLDEGFCSDLIENYISDYIGSDDCGNGTCDSSVGEDCSTCPEDCGICPCGIVGAPCTIDSDCCGEKCRGPTGGKTCK